MPTWVQGEDGKWRSKDRQIACEHMRRTSRCGICQPQTAIQTYKNNARRRGILWELTDAQAVWLMRQRCAYCGKAVAAGIDRAKNEYGYTTLNSVPCCFPCNSLKSNRTIKAFLVAVNATARYCPCYPKFKRRWTRIRKGLEKLCPSSNLFVVSATPRKKDSRPSRSPKSRSGVRVADNSQLHPAHLGTSVPGALESNAAL
jgi:hypothetical protein